MSGNQIVGLHDNNLWGIVLVKHVVELAVTVFEFWFASKTCTLIKPNYAILFKKNMGAHFQKLNKKSFKVLTVVCFDKNTSWVKLKIVVHIN